MAIHIGEQIWMTENLDETQFRNGDPIPEAKTNEEWVKAGNEGKPAYCNYGNEPANGEKYGKLYNWYAVSDPRRLAPDGWNIPGESDWFQFIKHLGEQGAGRLLKSRKGWNNNKNGEDACNFKALPGGKRKCDGQFEDIGDISIWWTVSKKNEKEIWFIYLGDIWGTTIRSFSGGDPREGFSVRCYKPWNY